MLTAQVHCATPVVGICSRHFENRATKMIEKLNMYLPDRAKNTPLYLYPQHRPSPKIFAKGMPLLYHVISFSYNAALLAEEDAKSPKSDFFPD